MERAWTERFAGIDRLYGRGALVRFHAARVAVVGLGGVGSWAAEALARTGLGHLTLIDADDLCVSNTNRQLPAVAGQYGRNKSEAMAERCRAINPASCESQIQGGFVQGLGYALTEAMHWNDEGWLTTTTLADYKIPGILDSPPEIHAIVLEDPDPTHPVGAKGIGEPSLVGAAPAIANAIRDAVGARVHRLPMTPERVLDAMDSAA